MDALERTLMTISCDDCAEIPKVADAGRIRLTAEGEVQIMHNGLQVVAGGYHGDWMAQIIRGLNGHHEPQEEAIFHALLRACRNNSIIVELGAFWAYYSLWYLHEIPRSKSICIEPDPSNKAIGERNAALNDMGARVTFKQAFVGGQFEEKCEGMVETLDDPIILPCYDADTILELCHLDTVEVLHLDVQGAELDFLSSCRRVVQSNRIRFLVCSTHHSSISGSPTTHEDCLTAIRSLGGRILAEHNVQESFSGDGLIVASFYPCDEFISFPPISRNAPHRSLFPDK